MELDAFEFAYCANCRRPWMVDRKAKTLTAIVVPFEKHILFHQLGESIFMWKNTHKIDFKTIAFEEQSKSVLDVLLVI